MQSALLAAGALMASLFLVCLCIQCYSNPPIELAGDTDGDGVLTVSDVVNVSSALLGIEPLDGLALIAADVDGNLELNISVK